MNMRFTDSTHLRQILLFTKCTEFSPVEIGSVEKSAIDQT